MGLSVILRIHNEAAQIRSLFMYWFLFPLCLRLYYPPPPFFRLVFIVRVELKRLSLIVRRLSTCDLSHDFVSTTGGRVVGGRGAGGFITLLFFMFFCFPSFGSSFLSYICFLYFPDDFCMLLLLLLSVSTVTARVPSRRFPGNGKLCTHGIIFE